MAPSSVRSVARRADSSLTGRPGRRRGRGVAEAAQERSVRAAAGVRPGQRQCRLADPGRAGEQREVAGCVERRELGRPADEAARRGGLRAVRAVFCW